VSILLVYTSGGTEMAVYISTGGLDGVHRMIGWDSSVEDYDPIGYIAGRWGVCITSLYKKSKKWNKEI
jgi:hypothetical protein